MAILPGVGSSQSPFSGRSDSDFLPKSSFGVGRWRHKALLAGGLIQTPGGGVLPWSDGWSQSPFSGRSDSDVIAAINTTKMVLSHKALLAGGLIQTHDQALLNSFHPPCHKALLAGGLIQTFGPECCR